MAQAANAIIAARAAFQGVGTPPPRLPRLQDSVCAAKGVALECNPILVEEKRTVVLVRIDPPGTICAQAAVLDAVRGRKIRTFVDIGCGSGTFSKPLCEAGLTGIGIDFSSQAIAAAAQNMSKYVALGTYKLAQHDITDCAPFVDPVDLGISYMVLEHVADDVDFLRRISALIRPGGLVIIGVPGRRDHWSIEDKIAGHLRRYERDHLARAMTAAGLINVTIWSVAVPIANLLFKIGILLLRQSGEIKKLNQNQREQTETSGLQEIPWKTIFPPWFNITLNRKMLYPLIVLQRLFYTSSLGVTLMGIGELPRASQGRANLDV